MMKPDVFEMHEVIESAGILLDSVQWNRELQVIELNFLRGATDDQKAAAQKIVDEWDQEAVDAAKAAAFDNLPNVDAIKEAKTVKELQAMALQLRDYIDAKAKE